MNISQRMKITRSIGMSTEGKTIFEQDNLTKREMYDKFNPNKISLKANSHRSARQHQQAWKGSGWQCTRRWCTWTWASIWTSTCTWPSSPWWKCKTTLVYLNMAVINEKTKQCFFIFYAFGCLIVKKTRNMSFFCDLCKNTLIPYSCCFSWELSNFWIVVEVLEKVWRVSYLVSFFG